MKLYKKASEILTDDPAEQAIIDFKFLLANEVIDLIKKNKLTQVEAAKMLGVFQSRVSRLSCGFVSEFSIGWLMKAKIKLQP